MSDITISTKEEDKPEKVPDVKETLKAADEYAKLKEQNDKLQAEYERNMELKAKIAVGGKSLAGQAVPEKTPQEKDAEEAKQILSMFR